MFTFVTCLSVLFFRKQACVSYVKFNIS